MRASTVLIVDRDRDTCHIIARLLSRVGMRTVCAEDQEQGMRSLEADAPVVALIEPSTFGREPWQATSRMVEQARQRNVPVLAFTALAFDRDREAGTAAGLRAYLTKPLRPSRIVEQVLAFAN